MKGESWKTWLFRQGINKYPMFVGTGGKALYLQGDWKKAIVRLRLGFWTRNYVGTIFGGSQYAAMDPFHVILLINCLDREFIVWDKAAAIKFRRPGTGAMRIVIEYTDEELATIREAARAHGKYEFVKSADWITDAGQVVSTVEKTLYVATKAYFKSRKPA